MSERPVGRKYEGRNPVFSVNESKFPALNKTGRELLVLFAEKSTTKKHHIIHKNYEKNFR